jgi:hypothetical protein
MRTATVVILLALVLANAYETRAQAPEEAFFNVFEIRVPGGTGTAFTMRVDGRQYLITAKHMVAKLKADGSPESIEISTSAGPHNSPEWKPLQVRIFTCDDPIDIAVLATQEFVGHSRARDFVEAGFGEQSLEPRTDGIPLGDEGYFLGFPFGYTPAEGPVGPLPFSKKATLSLNYWEGKADRMFFDGYNNPGFSGAPVLFRDPKNVRPNRSHFNVAGVVSGFIPQLVNTANWRRVEPHEDLTNVEAWRIKKKADGFTYVLEDTDTVVPLNTGIISAFNIRHAVDLIKAHPIGPLIPEVHVEPMPK